MLADPLWQQKVVKSGKTALRSSIVAAAATAGGAYKGHKLSKKVEAKKGGKKYTQGLISRKYSSSRICLRGARHSFSSDSLPGYKKNKNKTRGTHTKYAHLLKQHKSRKAVLKVGLRSQLSHDGSGSYGGLDLGDYEAGVPRSKNASPTHNYYR